MAKTKKDFIDENEMPTKQGKETFLDLTKQAQNEYHLAWQHQRPKKDEAEVRLKQYNNQKRDKDAVGDTTLFTTVQTVIASLYVDQLDVDWGGKEDGDEDIADNLNALSRSDYEDMGKNITDYEWIFDSVFFGRGLCLLEEYVREPEKNIYLPIPQILDPITFLRDPLATSVNGDYFGRGGCRFYGYEVKMTADDMENNSHIFKDIDMKDLKFGSGTKSILTTAKEARDTAQGRQNDSKLGDESNLGANSQYDITLWNTHYNFDGKVKKVKLWLANERTKVIGMKIYKNDYWPLIDRPLYPTSHDWDGVSVPDIVEDKQRARAMAQNLGLGAIKADLYPMYIYDSNKISNRNDLNFEFNKFIPMDAQGKSVGDAIMPLTKARPNLDLLNFIYNSLDISAQKATATPDIQQGMQSQKDRPLGETNLIASKVDTRYSLSAKIFGWSEKLFWQQWYRLYKNNFEDKIDEKVLRLVGAFGAKWRPLKKDNIIARLDPDVSIESRVLSRAKQLEERQALTQYFSLALQDPTSNRRWGLKKLGKLNGLEKDELERLFPPTIDERMAEQENDLLNKDELVEIKREDDHNVHLEIHNKANETKASTVHIKAHEKALSLKKEKPELFPQDPTEDTSFQGSGSRQTAQPSGGMPQRTIAPSQTSNSAGR